MTRSHDKICQQLGGSRQNPDHCKLFLARLRSRHQRRRTRGFRNKTRNTTNNQRNRALLSFSYRKFARLLSFPYSIFPLLPLLRADQCAHARLATISRKRQNACRLPNNNVNIRSEQPKNRMYYVPFLKERRDTIQQKYETRP